jgi:hypothetical protein
MRLGARISVVAAVIALSSASIARAQTPQSSTIAEALFREGKRLLEEGKTAEACEKFAASQRVEPATGTLLNLAACREKQGKTASAWTEYFAALSNAVNAGDKIREKYAREKIASLEKQLHRVVIEMISPPASTSVSLDGATLAREALGTGLPLDPGEHLIEVKAPGYQTWSRKISLGPGAGTDRIEVPPLEPEGSKEPVAPPPQEPPPERRVEIAPRPSDSPGISKRTVGFMVGGAGVVSLGASIFFGIKTLGHASDRDERCASGQPCFDQAAFDAHHDAQVSQTWMFVTGGIGLAAVGVGTWLIVTSKKDEKKAASVYVIPRASTNAASLDLIGRF